jgi:hypothetical protein
MRRLASLSSSVVMLDQEPLWYPSRTRNYPFDPGVSNRQLWAIGMIVVQWSMTETIIANSTRQLIAQDEGLLEKYKALRNFQGRLEFWQAQIEMKMQDPTRAKVLALIPKIQALSSQRDEVVHRLWGGGLESTSWGAGGAGPTTDAGMMPNPREKTKLTGAPMKWHATFLRLKKMAQEMATLNRDLFQIIMLPPSHSNEDGGSQIGP